MTEKLERCPSCNEPFEWNETVILVSGDLYHKDCLTLYPTGYVAFDGNHCLGETDNEDGDMAFEHLDDDELLEESS